MSTDLVKQLVVRMASDETFRARVQNADTDDERRKILEDAGYGDIRPEHVIEVIQSATVGELSDDEFAAVAGGGNTGAGALVGALGTVGTYLLYKGGKSVLSSSPEDVIDEMAEGLEQFGEM